MGKDRDSSFPQRDSHTYTLRLGYNRNFILYNIYIYILFLYSLLLLIIKNNAQCLWTSKKKKITAHSWCSGHFISINTCGAWRARVRVQVSRRELHLHIHLDYDKVEISTCWRVCWVKVEVQVFRRELHTHIHLDYDRIEILSCINIYIYIYIIHLLSFTINH